MRDQKGITLVALIITIIVMLILVAVTISIALNGGIFTKAREASDKTLKAQLEEAVTLAKADTILDYYEHGANQGAESAALGKFNPKSYLDDNWTVSVTPKFGDDFTVTGTNNNNTFTVTVNIPRSTSTVSQPVVTTGT